MNSLQTFNFENQNIRTQVINGEPYFVGKDVAEVLGYTNERKAIRDHVEQEDKLTERIVTSGQGRYVTLINESGLYSLIFASKLPEAKRFKRWVTNEVLPAIRKHGVYALDEMLNNPDAIIKALEAYKVERAAREVAETQCLVLEQRVHELQPKASYYDLILQCPDLISVSRIAKDYGMSAKGLNKILHDLKIQYNQGGIWLLYSKYQAYGYTQTKTNNYFKTDGSQGAKQHTYWTQKGRLFLYDVLKKNGILPTIERQEELSKVTA